MYLAYKENIFCDDTFYTAPSISDQLLITRIYSKDLHTFFTTSFCLMKNKEQKNYENVFKEIKNNIIKYSHNKVYSPKEFHCDFEIYIPNAFLKIFPNTKIRYCLWHMIRSLENKAKIYIHEDKNLYFLYKCILNLPFIDPNYVEDLFNYIKEKNTNDNFNHFFDYFKDNYIDKYGIKNWNYFENIKNTINNCCEAYNNKLNNLFNKKPTYFELLYKLREEEDLIRKEHIRLTTGIWSSKKNYEADLMKKIYV